MAYIPLVGEHAGAIRLAELTMSGKTVQSVGTAIDYTRCNVPNVGKIANEDQSQQEFYEQEISRARTYRREKNPIVTDVASGNQVASSNSNDEMTFEALMTPTEFNDFRALLGKTLIVSSPWLEANDSDLSHVENMVGKISGDIEGSNSNGFLLVPITIVGTTVSWGTVDAAALNTAMRGGNLTPDQLAAITLADFVAQDLTDLEAGTIVTTDLSAN